MAVVAAKGRYYAIISLYPLWCLELDFLIGRRESNSLFVVVIYGLYHVLSFVNRVLRFYLFFANYLYGKSLINLGNVDVGIDTLKIYSNGTTIKLIVKWKNTLHAISFDTNDKLYIQISTDSGSTWKNIREI